MSLQPTSSQTVGPYFAIGLTWLNTHEVAPAGVAGERIVIEGTVFDGDGKPVPDALIEVWQANADGKYNADGFPGFGRIPADAKGMFKFSTIKPGSVDKQAPHINISVFMRGILRQLVTRIYFPNEASNAEDAVLNSVPEARRATLVAQAVGGDKAKLSWNVVVQGKDETVFFDF